MNLPQYGTVRVRRKLGWLITSLWLSSLLISEAAAQSTFGGNAQHTAVYSPAAQNLNAIHWTASIDLNNTGGFAHYGAPVITPAKTIFVPVKTGVSGGFRINVFNAVNGATMYSSLSTDYIQPSHNWILPYQPALATGPTETRLYYPGAGGTIYYINNVDAAVPGTPVQQVFYTSLANYQANRAAYNSSVFINTPITADSNGNVFFGFRVDNTAPAPLSTTQSGFARIRPDGTATYVLAGAAANDNKIGRDTHNSGPALSNDQSTVYVVVKSSTSESYGYLLGLDSTTLATKYKVFLKDPRNNNANNATILDDSTASPMVGPDGDVYFGIYGNPANGSRGFMLHFSGDLSIEKPPGGFGWDNTVSVVPAAMVPSYRGSSSYLLFSKYNNYANAGNDSGDGGTRGSLLEPNPRQVDAHASSNGMLIMREVLTVIGPTADPENRSASLPYAVREWCINTAAVNPTTNSVFVPSEDGHIYRWDLVKNSLTQFLQLNPGIGEPYVPSIIGPDGTVYTLNGVALSAMGNPNGAGVSLTSSIPDVRNVVTGDSLTFTVTITDTVPFGTVALQDTVYSVPSPGVLNSRTTTLLSNATPDGNGQVVFTTSALTADKHFISATYSNNGTVSSSSLVQFVHPGGSRTTLVSSPNPSNPGQSVTFTATVAASPQGSGIPTGMVTLLDGNTVLAQAPLNSSGVVSFNTSGLALGSHSMTAVYASDTNFAASSGSTTQSVQSGQSTTATTTSVGSSMNPAVFGQSVTFTATVTAATGSITPTGIVTFKDGGTTLGTTSLDAKGQATLATSTLAAGSHSITAVYGGASGFTGSTSPALTQAVNQDTTNTTVTSSSSTSFHSQPVTFTATVVAKAPGSGTPTGKVTFKEGNKTLGNGNLGSSGQASITVSNLSKGMHQITAVYAGNSNFLSSTSAVLVQTVN